MMQILLHPPIWVFILFFTKYAIGVMNGMQVFVVREPGFVLMLSSSCGCFSDIFSEEQLIC